MPAHLKIDHIDHLLYFSRGKADFWGPPRRSAMTSVCVTPLIDVPAFLPLAALWKHQHAALSCTCFQDAPKATCSSSPSLSLTSTSALSGWLSLPCGAGCPRWRTCRSSPAASRPCQDHAVLHLTVLQIHRGHVKINTRTRTYTVYTHTYTHVDTLAFKFSAEFASLAADTSVKYDCLSSADRIPPEAVNKSEKIRKGSIGTARLYIGRVSGGII